MQVEDAVERLKEIRNEILNLVQEADDVLRFAVGRSSMIYKRADSYWIPTVKDTVNKEGRGSMVTMDDTIEELEEEMTEEEESEESEEKGELK